MTYVLGHNIECPTSFWWIILVAYNITNLYLTRKQWNWLENLIDVARWYSSRTFYTPSQGVIQNLFWSLRFTHIFERKTMNSHCLLILSLMFPLHSISAQASSCNEGCSLTHRKKNYCLARWLQYETHGLSDACHFYWKLK